MLTAGQRRAVEDVADQGHRVVMRIVAVEVVPKSSPVAGTKVSEPLGSAPSLILHLPAVGPSPNECNTVSVPVGMASGTSLMARAAGAIVSDSATMRIANVARMHLRSNRTR